MKRVNQEENIDYITVLLSLFQVEIDKIEGK